MFCPGTFQDPNRYFVQPAFYSANLTNPVDERYRELPCEPDKYSIKGERFSCGRTFCWPMPISILAREASLAEGPPGAPLSPAGEGQYYLQRKPGLSVGDVLVIQFDEDSTMPTLNQSTIFQALNFSAAVGALASKWNNPRELQLTITDVAKVSDPMITRVATHTGSAAVMNYPQYTYRGDSSTKVEMSLEDGTWPGRDGTRADGIPRVQDPIGVREWDPSEGLWSNTVGLMLRILPAANIRRVGTTTLPTDMGYTAGFPIGGT